MKLWFKVSRSGRSQSSSSSSGLSFGSPGGSRGGRVTNPATSCGACGARKRRKSSFRKKKRRRDNINGPPVEYDVVDKENGSAREGVAVMIARDLFRRGKISGAELSEIIEGDKLFWRSSPIIAGATSLDGSQAENETCDGTTALPKAEELSQVESNLGSDPIMLVDLEPDDIIYEFTRPNGKIVRFNVVTLIDYMLSTGRFHEPESRILFSEEELEAIDNCAASGGVERPSTAKASKCWTEKYAAQRFVRDAIEGLERCGGEVITELLELIEDPFSFASSPPSSPTLPSRFTLPARNLGHVIETSRRNRDSTKEVVQMKILTDIFPRAKHYLSQISDQDHEKAKQAVSHWKLFLQGPPNKPTVDELELLPCCMSLLDGALQR